MLLKFPQCSRAHELGPSYKLSLKHVSVASKEALLDSAQLLRSVSVDCSVRHQRRDIGSALERQRRRSPCAVYTLAWQRMPRFEEEPSVFVGHVTGSFRWPWSSFSATRTFVPFAEWESPVYRVNEYGRQPALIQPLPQRLSLCSAVPRLPALARLSRGRLIFSVFPRARQP